MILHRCSHCDLYHDGPCTPEAVRTHNAAASVREKIARAESAFTARIARGDSFLSRPPEPNPRLRDTVPGARAWRQTNTGRQVFPLDPRPGDFAIEDIAWQLAGQNRYGGAGRFVYTTAEHSVLCSLFGDPAYALRKLLHDAHEAVLGFDLPGPLKRHPLFRDLMNSIEEPIDRVLFAQFGCEEPGDYKAIDYRILADERAALFPGDPPADWWPADKAPEPLGAPICGWSQRVAFDVFMARFSELCPDYKGP